jgi:hypothetical protein
MGMDTADFDLPQAPARRPAKSQRPSRGSADPVLALLEELERFVEDRVLVRSYPLGTHDAHYFAGPIKREHLFDSPWSYYAKYGYGAVDGITLFGQVALVPEPELPMEDDFAAEPSDEAPQTTGLEELLDQMLQAFPNDLLATARWPRVTVTPIAIFRSTSAETAD